jgi:hypothetical protein
MERKRKDVIRRDQKGTKQGYNTKTLRSQNTTLDGNRRLGPHHSSDTNTRGRTFGVHVKENERCGTKLYHHGKRDDGHNLRNLPVA